ncbi:Uncharacterised protein [Sphingobacterium thalpophilum]|uniref:Uncharacterized protein n=1 Tax=Sphingobacterium thalpophilum TaxID=259 RepID=A0A4U9U7T0_9SPHI|nr:Uncharacterised protein [Sphingobacterium thalpophilum]
MLIHAINSTIAVPIKVNTVGCLYDPTMSGLYAAINITVRDTGKKQSTSSPNHALKFYKFKIVRELRVPDVDTFTINSAKLTERSKAVFKKYYISIKPNKVRSKPHRNTFQLLLYTILLLNQTNALLL